MLRYWSSVVCAVSLVGPWMGGPGGGGGGGRGVWGLTCVGQGPCGCAFDDGSGAIDVSSLGNTDSTPRFADVRGKDNFLYSYNPCYPFSEGNCTDAAVCQVGNGTQSYRQIGDAKPVQWLNSTQAYLLLQALSETAASSWGESMKKSYANVSVTAYYEHVEQLPQFVIRESFVTFVCDPVAKVPLLEATGGDGTHTTFFFRLTTQCACPNGCVRGTSGSSSLSAGSVFLIVFFVVLFVYLTGGVLINRICHQATGLEMVPNINFWRSLLGHAQDGCLFVTCQFHKTKETYTEVS
ncbi:cation-dependent mannose-6-phosphate receptor-like [Babylonia areolata]|uniref:cation-dependent mannose-6-phosphate receptor-like n=1 Tax=Babylonia areolata TaxID=304850 RepID=UPI003FD31ABC